MRQSAAHYLSTILLLEQQFNKVRSVDIVRATGYSKPSVSVAMKKLLCENFIYVNHKNEILLTEEGRYKAEGLLNTYALLEEALQIIGVSQKIAKEDASKIGHVIHYETLEKIKAFIIKYKT